MKLGKKRIIDSVDRDILKILDKTRRPLSGNELAQRVKYSAPSINPRLRNLNKEGIIKPVLQGKPRIFTRQFTIKNKVVNKTIRSPSKILWGLDLIDAKKKKRK